ncbi:hypothetical protein AB0G86_18710 [Streptomyces scabiei]|uniref:hypothetical protein n=1 Tax=Streptomyces scabiei TaxID=1930 RepID=UPI0033C4AAE3
MSEAKTTYEVWNFRGSGSPELVSDNPVEIVHWLRERPVEERHFNVHPKGPRFHTGKKIAHDFISIHSNAVADDIVMKAFESGNPDGVAQEVINLVFGR